MPALVGSLAAALGDGEELVAEVEEGHAAHATAQLEREQAPVELECGVEVADLKGDVVDPDEPSRGHIGSLPEPLSGRRGKSYFRWNRSPWPNPRRCKTLKLA